MNAMRVRVMNFPREGKSRSKSRTSLLRNRAVEARMRARYADCGLRDAVGERSAVRVTSRQVLSDLLLQRPGVGPDERVDVLPVLEEHHGRDGAHVEADRRLLVRVDVELGDLELSGVLLRHLVEVG